MISRRLLRSPSRGFTLIELMIAVVVVGILAAAAYPLYTEFVQRSRITDATSQLSDFRVRQEQAFQDFRRYDDGGGANCAVQPLLPVFVAAKHNFQFTCTFLPGAIGGYRLVADGNAGKGMGPFDYELRLDPVTGVLTRTTLSVPAGWSLPAPNDCWATRKSGQCS